MKLSEEQINMIAEDLESGMQIFLNIETKEIKTILKWDELASDEFWETELMEIEDNPDKYIGFVKMNSHEGFRLMEDFIETIDNEELKKNLQLELRLLKPFSNFEDIIDNENEYRKKWFEFKHAGYVEFVKKQLALYNEEKNNSH